MSRGAITLLAIAQENDRHKKIADNEALRAALEYVARLVVLCSKENVSGVRSLLGLRELPANWFGFCVAIVDAIESRIDTLAHGDSDGWSARTDFDRSVFLAIGQSIGDLLREYRGERLTLDVKTDSVLVALRQATSIHLQRLLIRNYVGNILQELFDTCKIRLSAPGLSKDTEQNLRERDAQALADTLFERYNPNNTIVDVVELLALFRNTLAEIWIRDASSLKK